MPIFKKGRNSDPNSYRPISLTCVSCKLMEHILASHIMHHGKRHNLLYDLQHGFRDKRSSETQLLQFQDDLIRNMSNRAQTDVLIMDFAKAFDKVGHRPLLWKLNYYGIDKKTQIWVQGFLSDRTQTVVLDGEKLYVADVVWGVPQGSVLGPCLFLYYINDIPVGLESTVRLFPDDTIAYLTVTSASDAKTLQQDLHKLGDWEKKWHMEFHPAKFQVLTVSRKRNPIHYEYKLHGHILEHVTSAKYLGVTFTSDMRWGQHVNNITSKANKTLDFIRRDLQLSSPQTQDHRIYDPSTTTPRVRTICMGPVCAEGHQESGDGTKARNEVCHQPVPQYIQWTYATDYGRFSFFPRTIQDWNNLPRHLAEAPSPDSFRAHLSKGLQTA